MNDAPPGSRRRWAALVFISIAVSLIIVDSTIVNVAVPSIVGDLGLTSTQVQWVQEAYTLVFASLLLLFGVFADRWGRRRVLLTGVAIFTLASVGAALAPTGGALIALRVLQGAGGAMMLPTTLSLINATFRGRERAIAFAIWGSTIGGMAAVGPLLGGWLTTAFSWRWAFGINVPLGILIILGVLLTVIESKAPRSGGLDIVGALLAVVLFSSLVFALIEGRTFGWWASETAPSIGDWTWPWPVSPIPFAFALAAVALALFLLRGRRRHRAGRATLVEFRLFRLASFRNGNVVAMVVALGEFGLILALPLWLQFVLGFEAVQTGLVLLALAGGSFAASGLAGAFSGRVAPVLVVRLGLVCEIVGIAAVGFVVAPDAAWGWLLPGLAVYGFGVGLATAQLTGVILADVPVEMSGQGSGMQSTSRQIGSALGIAILGTVLYGATGTGLAARLDEAGMSPPAAAAVVSAVVDSAGAAIPPLLANPETRATGQAAASAFSDGTRIAAWTAAGFLVLGLGASFSLGGARRREETDPTAIADPAPRA
ncbi:DHA2 family efflux MFS transporter permease subunit [Microbacterium sp. SORGH_AS_0888]|uniref:DHA2 family efflux MFS transporter permease subunit n=1 Tax=Microbacterium sp. SORGH_AS_0888 TaxID=3041791 RepID=UPI002786A798|nr:DHA2 family efflux MFS transporter permease subunit [Microbacterium sp. SORGH_AS_0888]MDQ1129220.1 EmrB/QacA subfamily drug resistance transporter [Microbacterium sp. SORGH_AS_0888]